MGQTVHVVQQLDQAQTALQPIRLSILERLEEPGSASSLAPDLGLPRQQVNYHLRELERVGLVEFVSEKRRGNCVERLYRSSARSYVFSPSVGALRADPDKVRDRLSAEYLVAVGARLIEDLTILRSATEKKVPTLAIETTVAFKDQEQRAAFAEDLAAAIAGLARKYHNGTSSAEPYRLIVAAHPIATQPKENNHE